MSDNQTTPLIDSSGPSVMPIYIILFLLFLSILFNILITFKIVNLDKILNPDPKKENFINNNNNDYRQQEYYRQLQNHYIQ